MEAWNNPSATELFLEISHWPTIRLRHQLPTSVHTHNSWHLPALKNDPGALILVSSTLFLRRQNFSTWAHVPDIISFSWIAQMFLSKKKGWLVNLAMSLLLTEKEPLCSSKNLCCLVVKYHDEYNFFSMGNKKSDYVCITSKECNLVLRLRLLKFNKVS